MPSPPLVGILGLQGDFLLHRRSLNALDAASHIVRTADELDICTHLIIPGGESTTMATLMDIYELREPLLAHAHGGKPIWGTCAGLILLATRLVEDRPEPLGLMEMRVHRSGFGRQIDSFEADLEVSGLGGQPFHGVFIRAPVVCETGAAVRVLARLEEGPVVAAQQGHLLATSFHPELTPDLRFHQYFVDLVAEAVTS
ncbi:MAG: pyridoxal 5'-phosphate synthase glutaminase subunit PdxT [Proteobacteria bacterium]|nr:pyridoxal 5'-phosphate synthase glutaminase subunit PdxT [Pseudomonadota bacterium]